MVLWEDNDDEGWGGHVTRGRKRKGEEVCGGAARLIWKDHDLQGNVFEIIIFYEYNVNLKEET